MTGDGPAHCRSQSTPGFKHGTSRGRGPRFLTVIKNSKHRGRPPSSVGLLAKQKGVWVGTLRPGTETSLLAQCGSWVASREQCPRRAAGRRLCQKPRRRVLGVEQLMLAAKVLAPSAGTHRHTTASTVGRPSRKRKSGQLSSAHVLSAPPSWGLAPPQCWWETDQPLTDQTRGNSSRVLCCRAGKGCSGLVSAQGNPGTIQ